MPNSTASIRVSDRKHPGGVLWAALGSALAYGASLVHPVLVVSAAFSPLPLLIVRLRAGAAGAALALVAAAALVALAAPGRALWYVLFLALPALLVSESVARGRGMVRGCAWGFGLVTLEILTVLLFAGPRIEQATLREIDAYRSPAFLETLKTGGWGPEQIEAWMEQVAMTRGALLVIYPSAYIVMGGLMVLANASLLRLYLRRRDPGWLETGEFERIRWPVGIAVVFVAAGLSVLSPVLRPLGYNVLVLVAVFFALQGLAVVCFYAARLAAPPLVRGVLLFLVLANPWAAQILALVGLLDIFFDFRKWAEPPEPQRG